MKESKAFFFSLKKAAEAAQALHYANVKATVVKARFIGFYVVFRSSGV